MCKNYLCRKCNSKFECLCKVCTNISCGGGYKSCYILDEEHYIGIKKCSDFMDWVTKIRGKKC